MRTMTRIEKRASVLHGFGVEFFSFEQLRVSEDCGQGIVQLVGHACDELSDSRHLFALQELLLSVTKIIVCLAGFFVEADFLNRRGKLTSNGDQEIPVIQRITLMLPAA